ncbi:metallophosphoesterase family protein [Leucobacter sp. USCH14]|uniref:metallophosphoesterase n=1 Tax=Leucobacter sp. USCH14 TaxID=3024838 RepID=UPI0030B7B20C
MTSHPARSTAAVLGAAAVGVLTWSTLIERRLFTVRRHALPVLPEARTPIRVLQLSDLHLAPWQAQKVDWVRSLSELRPDLVVLTGDLMGHREALPALVHALRPLVAHTPSVFVHGSNDYYGPLFKNPMKYLLEPSRRSTRTPDLDNVAITRALTDLGAIDLNNSATRLTIRGSRVELLGLNDPHIRYDDPDRMRAAAAALSSQGENGDGDDAASVRLGVVHAPYQEALGALLTEGSDVIFAGHTHGGQVRVPGVGALTANCDLPTEQARGLSVWFDAHRAAFLNVSAGLGNSIYAPVRFACRPEASLLTLESP